MSHSFPSSTGAFVYRSDRSPPKAQQTTPAVVGPGSYDIVRQNEVQPAPAPFHTSTVRALAANPTTSAITPGPGAYDGAARAAAGGGISAGAAPVSSFVSGVPRLATHKPKIEVPGPGSYDAGNPWAKGGPRYAPASSRTSGSSPAHASLGVVPRRPTAPSVPGRGQSYGYEEAPDGTLVLQSAPDKAHSGVGRDTVGPGSYELAGKGLGGKGTKWANSKAGRSLKFGSITPGPGTYNLAESGPRRPGAGLTVNIGGVDVVFGGTQGTSSFVSKAPRPLQRAAAPAPGPGEYLGPDVRPAGSGTSPLRGSPAAFGCTGVRGSWDVDPTRSRAAPTYWKTPGPGAYEEPRAVSLGRMHTHPGAASGAGALLAASAAAAPFASTALRFGQSDNKQPGPGDYHSDVVTSLEFDAYKKATGSRPTGGFGVSTGRFSYQRGNSSPPRQGLPDGVLPGGLGVGEGATPGPGAYDVARDGAQTARTGRAGTSAFTSSTGRFRPITAPPAVPDLTEYDGVTPPKGDPSRLGPGAYSPEKPSSKTRYTHSMAKAVPFGTEAQRANLELPSRTNPAPGHYDSHAAADALRAKPVSLPPGKAGFATATDRFGNNAPGKYTPGPGAYVGNDSSIVRKSYNVTYHGPGVA